MLITGLKFEVALYSDGTQFPASILADLNARGIADENCVIDGRLANLPAVWTFAGVSYTIPLDSGCVNYETLPPNPDNIDVLLGKEFFKEYCVLLDYALSTISFAKTQKLP